MSQLPELVNYTLVSIFHLSHMIKQAGSAPGTPGRRRISSILFNLDRTEMALVFLVENIHWKNGQKNTNLFSNINRYIVLNSIH